MMLIRDMIKEDHSQYTKMAKKFYQSHAVHDEVDKEHFEVTFEMAMKDQTLIRALLIEEDGIAAGYALLTFAWSCEYGKIVITTDELFIDDDYQGKGIGSKFFKWLEQEYPLHSYVYHLLVNPENPKAKALYQRLGYEELSYQPMIKLS